MMKTRAMCNLLLTVNFTIGAAHIIRHANFYLFRLPPPLRPSSRYVILSATTKTKPEL